MEAADVKSQTRPQKNWALFQDKQTTQHKKSDRRKTTAYKRKLRFAARRKTPQVTPHYQDKANAAGDALPRASETPAKATQSRAFLRPLPKRDAGATETAVGPGRPPTRLGHRPWHGHRMYRSSFPSSFASSGSPDVVRGLKPALSTPPSLSSGLEGYKYRSLPPLRFTRVDGYRNIPLPSGDRGSLSMASYAQR